MFRELYGYENANLFGEEGPGESGWLRVPGSLPTVPRRPSPHKEGACVPASFVRVELAAPSCVAWRRQAMSSRWLCRQRIGGRAAVLAELTIANATRKARAAARINCRECRGRYACRDGGEIIGKPCDLNHARILRRLSGRTHDVCTAVCIVCPRGRISFANFAGPFSQATESAYTVFRWWIHR